MNIAPVFCICSIVAVLVLFCIALYADVFSEADEEEPPSNT